MKGVSTASLIVGFLAGSVIVGGLMLAVRRTEHELAPRRSAERPPPSEPAPDLAEENGELRQRIAELERQLEAALKKIEGLERQIEELKTAGASGGGGLSIAAIKPLIDRVARLEKGALNSPLFNLYEKFTCSSCGSHGAAQARARCGVCGKEGWFGRKQPLPGTD